MSRQKVSSMSVAKLQRTADDIKNPDSYRASKRLRALADSPREPKSGHVRRLNG